MFKAAAPCDLYREQIGLNGSSYSGTAGADSDEFRMNAITEGMPMRATHTHDNTAYSSQPTLDSWVMQLRSNKGQV